MAYVDIAKENAKSFMEQQKVLGAFRNLFGYTRKAVADEINAIRSTCYGDLDRVMQLRADELEKSLDAVTDYVNETS